MVRFSVAQERKKKEDTLNALRISSEETFWPDVRNTRFSRTIHEYLFLLKNLDIGNVSAALYALLPGRVQKMIVFICAEI